MHVRHSITKSGVTAGQTIRFGMNGSGYFHAVGADSQRRVRVFPPIKRKTVWIVSFQQVARRTVVTFSGDNSEKRAFDLAATHVASY